MTSRWSSMMGAAILLAVGLVGCASEVEVSSRDEKLLKARSSFPTGVLAGSATSSSLGGSSDGRSFDEQLDKVVDPPNALGFVRGVITGKPSPVELDVGYQDIELLEYWLDYPMRVTGFKGVSPAPYEVGSAVSVRLPAVIGNGVFAPSDEAPTLAVGMDVFVLVRDYGELGGGNSDNRIVAYIKGSDAYEVRGDKVYGQGRTRNRVSPLRD